MVKYLKGYLDKGYKKLPEIQEHLLSQGIVISDRKLRKELEKIKNDYILGLSDWTIASNPNDGYILTRSAKEIAKSRDDYMSRGIDCLKKAKGIEKQLGYQDMIYLPIYDVQVSLDDLVKAFED